MKRGTLRRSLAVMAVAAAAGCVGGEVDDAGPTRDRIAQEFATIPQYQSLRRCAKPGPGEMACHARIRLDAKGQLTFAATPQAVSGLGPSDLQSAYKVDATL